MRILIRLMLFCLICAALSRSTLSQVYKWKDKDGNVIISSTPPPPGVDSEKREIEGKPTASPLDPTSEIKNGLNGESSDESEAASEEALVPKAAQPLIDGVMERINYRKSIAALFDAGNLAALEEKVIELRRTRPRFSSGTPVLYDFYAAFNPVSEHISQFSKDDYASRLMKWADANPDSFIAQMAKISVHIYRAWKARGSGNANTVTKRGWEVFEKELQEAWSVAKALEEKGIPDPILYHDMLVLGRGLGKPRPEVDAIFDKLISIDPAFDQGYIAMAEYLLPRWHGSAAELHDFALKSIQLTNEPVMYARIAIYVSVTEGPDMVQEYPFQYKMLKNALKTLNHRYPDSAMLVNLAAWFAYHYGDTAAAKPLIDRISQEWTRDANDVWHGRYSFDRLKQQFAQNR